MPFVHVHDVKLHYELKGIVPFAAHGHRQRVIRQVHCTGFHGRDRI